MATETKHFAICDRCGADDYALKPDETPETWGFVEMTYKSKTNFPGGDKAEEQKDAWDLCTDCKQELFQWLRRKVHPRAAL